MNKSRAWLYCRTAYPDLDALEIQRAHLTDYANKHGFSVVGITAEHCGGWDFMRPGLCDVLIAAEDGMIDTILVEKLSRLGRDLVKIDCCLHWLKQRDVVVVCVDGTVPQTRAEMLAHLIQSSNIHEV